MRVFRFRLQVECARLAHLSTMCGTDGTLFRRTPKLSNAALRHGKLLQRRAGNRRRTAVRAVAYHAALIAIEPALAALPHYCWQTYDRVSLEARASADCRSRRTAGICEVVAALGCRHRSCIGNLRINQ